MINRVKKINAGAIKVNAVLSIFFARCYPARAPAKRLPIKKFHAIIIHVYEYNRKKRHTQENIYP